MQSSGECIVIIVGENIIDTSIFKEIFLKIINTIKFNVRIEDVEYQRSGCTGHYGNDR